MPFSFHRRLRLTVQCDGRQLNVCSGPLHGESGTDHVDLDHLRQRATRAACAEVAEHVDEDRGDVADEAPRFATVYVYVSVRLPGWRLRGDRAVGVRRRGATVGGGDDGYGRRVDVAVDVGVVGEHGDVHRLGGIDSCAVLFVPGAAAGTERMTELMTAAAAAGENPCDETGETCDRDLLVPAMCRASSRSRPARRGC